VHVETVVSELRGARQMESVVLRSRGSAGPTTVQTHYLLAMIGAQPHTQWFPPELVRGEKGFILTGDAVPPAFRDSYEWSALSRTPYLYETSLPGVFAVGDVRSGSVKRVAAAAGEGSMAVRLVQQYLGLVPASRTATPVVWGERDPHNLEALIPIAPYGPARADHSQAGVATITGNYARGPRCRCTRP
jgi:hypothetical protein